MRKLRNNKGISLVELIVTVAILAVIVLPLLRAFVVSANTNAKAKERLRTTEVAQNIMEGFELESLESVAYQMNYPTNEFTLFDTESGFSAFEVLPTAGATPNYVKATKVDNIDDILPPGLDEASKEIFIQNALNNNIYSSIWLNGGDPDDYRFVGHPSGDYYFVAKNISANGKSYDALISIKASNAVDGNGTIINNSNVIQLNSIDAKHDATPNISNEPDKVLIKLGVVDSDNNVPQADVSRVITIDVKKVSDTTLVTVSYQYTWTDNGGGTSITHTVPAIAGTNSEYMDVVFDNSSDTSNDLENVYLCFYPWYTSTQANLTDKIVINNPDKLDVNFILVKQQMNATGLQNLEDNYRVVIDVRESMGATATKTASTIRTNLNTNLATGTATVADQGILALNGATTSDAETKIPHSGLTVTEANDRLYDVTIEIYPAETFDDNGNMAEDVNAITTLTGGMVN